MKKIVAIFLTLLLLATSLNVTYATHFCGGMEVETQWVLGQKHLTCGMEQMADRCLNDFLKALPSFSKKCCENSYQSIYSATMTDKKLEIGFPKLTFVPLILPLNFLATSRTNSFELSHPGYKPPELKREIPILIQSFLL